MSDCRPPIPILRSFDAAAARRFYLDYLGFAVVFEHRLSPEAPLYMSVRRGACELHLSEHHGDATPGSALRIEVPDVRAFLEEVRGRGHPNANPGIESRPWGFDEMSVTDPFGNRLVFCTPLPNVT